MSRRRMMWILTGLALAGLILAVAVVVSGRAGGHAPYQTGTRTYYVAAESGRWNYAPGGRDLVTGRFLLPNYQAHRVAGKRRFREFTGADFATAKPDEPALGILGPVIRGVPGDTIKIVFRNKTDQPVNLRAPELPGAETAGTDAVAPGQTVTYIWRLAEAAGPAAGQGSSRVWPYASTAGARDQNAGLIGAVIVTDRAHATPDASPDDVDNEYLAWFKVFDESAPDAPAAEVADAQMHSINGLVYSNLTGYAPYRGARTRWHLIADPAEADVGSADWMQPAPATELARRTMILGDAKLDVRTVDLKIQAAGEKIFHTIHPDHREFGMTTIYRVGIQPNQVYVWVLTHSDWFWPAFQLLLLAGWIYGVRRGRLRMSIMMAVLGVASVWVFWQNHPTAGRPVWALVIILGCLPAAALLAQLWRRRRRR